MTSATGSTLSITGVSARKLGKIVTDRTPVRCSKPNMAMDQYLHILLFAQPWMVAVPETPSNRIRVYIRSLKCTAFLCSNRVRECVSNHTIFRDASPMLCSSAFVHAAHSDTANSSASAQHTAAATSVPPAKTAFLRNLQQGLNLVFT